MDGVVARSKDGEEGRRPERVLRAACEARGSNRYLLEVPHFAFFRVFEDLRAVEVGGGWVGERAVIKDGKGFPDGGVPWLGAGDGDGGADADGVEDFSC